MAAEQSNRTLQGRLTRRQALIAGAAVPPLIQPAMSLCRQQEVATAVGPLLGHVDHNTAILWYRPPRPGTLVASVTNAKTGQTSSKTAVAQPQHDLCVTWRFDDLEADTEYAYAISHEGAIVAQGRGYTIRTAPPPELPAKTVLGMGSCASSTQFFDIWSQIAAHNIDGLMLLGDTPYIDNTQLAVNRARHREFLSIPTLAALAASTPVWGTWDDHDFGGNDTDGKVARKSDIRQAFTEYRAQTQFGDGQHGVYTKFRRGPVEVFMIDPRYFSQTEPSPVDPGKPTCLGQTQWQWLLDGLRQSTATFKLLATGMIWDDKKNGEKDDWETYAHEREALFHFIGANQITGVVLIGGDIHVSRHLKYPLADRMGYDLHQFVISPLHDRVIPSLNVPHPHLQWGQPLKNMFLIVTADTTGEQPHLNARWIDRTGKVHRQVDIVQEA